jgi:hypothetical protein
MREGQRALAGARYKKIIEPRTQAKRNSKLRHSKTVVPQNSAEREGEARDQAAKAFNVSHFSVACGETVLDHGAPELIYLVDTGQLGVEPAALVAEKLAKPVQAQLAADGPCRNSARAAIVALMRSWAISF